MTKLFIVVMALLGMTFAVNGAPPKRIVRPRLGFVEVPRDFPIQALVMEASVRFNNQIKTRTLYAVKKIFKAEKLEPEYFGPQYRIEVQFAQTDCTKQRTMLDSCHIIDGGDQPKARIDAKGNMDNLVSMTVTPHL